MEWWSQKIDDAATGNMSMAARIKSLRSIK